MNRLLPDKSAALGIIGFAIIFFGSSYIFPFISPSSASLAESGTISMNTLINGEQVNLQWEVRLESPQPYFQGVDELMLYAENEDYSMYVTLPLPSRHKDSSSRIWINSSRLLTQYTSQAKDNPIFFDVNKYDSGMKSIALRASIDLPVTILQREETGMKTNAPKSISLELHGQIDIDSSFYYEWSSKGGDTYRL
jgi:hypothetical protein